MFQDLVNLERVDSCDMKISQLGRKWSESRYSGNHCC